MKNNLFPLLILLFLVLFTNSCKKDDSTDLVDESFLIKTLEVEASNSLRKVYFFYDNQERLDSFSIVDNFTLSEYVYGVNVEYPSEDKIIMTTTEIHFDFVSSTIELELTDGCVTKRTFFNHQFETSFITEISCNENNQMLTKQRIDESGGGDNSFIEYEYLEDSLIMTEKQSPLSNFVLRKRKGYIVNLKDPFPTAYTYYLKNENLGCFLKEVIIEDYVLSFPEIIVEVHDQLIDIKRLNNTNWPEEIDYEIGQQGFSNAETHKFTYY